MPYDPMLSTPEDHLRFHLGDISDTNQLIPDATYQSQYKTYGWTLALKNCANHLLTRFGQEPVKFKEAAGANVDFTARMKQWQRVFNNPEAIPDPFASVQPSAQFNSMTTDIVGNW